MSLNILVSADREKFKKLQPRRFKIELQTAEYLDLRGADLSPLSGIETDRLEKMARVLRGLIFAAVEAGQSGHPGGSSSKAEQLLALVLGGAVAFDPLNPKNPGRDRVVWSAGHCTPAHYGLLSLLYECLRRVGRQFSPAVVQSVFPEDLVRYRRAGGPGGHVEHHYPLADLSTGSSGHGLSAAGGLAITHRSCGLPTKVWVIMGDAETEEGISYEARNLLAANGINNLIVTLDYNHFGIDGPIEEVMSAPYVNHWLGLGWNVIEADGHNILELIYAYRLAAAGFNNGSPTVVLAHTLKGKDYGNRENTAASHGGPAPHAEYVKIMKALGFDVVGEAGKTEFDIVKVLEKLTPDDEQYVDAALTQAAEKIRPEGELVKIMEKNLAGRPFIRPTGVRRPDKLPPELVFKPGDNVSTRQAAGAFFQWLMKQTAFFYAGAGDLAHSTGLDAAEAVHGVISRKNPFGRGLRFGIAEPNMAMMFSALTQDVLPGGFQPITVFGTYGVFTNMTGNAVRMTLVGNCLKPDTKGFFIMLASHDGPETGEDGPTHQGLYWMSLYDALPGIKVYKPTDANETVEMLFYALEKGEPIALSLARPALPVLKRSAGAPACAANQGAYVYYESKKKSAGKKKIVLVICGAQLLLNAVEILPELEKKYHVKIITVTSPELFEELRAANPQKAQAILSDDEREAVVTLHNGWPGFLYPFLLPKDYARRALGVSDYLKSGTALEAYEMAGLTPENIGDKIVQALNL